MSDIEKSPIDSRMGSLSAAGTSTSASGTTLLKAEADPEKGQKSNKQGGDTDLASDITLMQSSYDLPSTLDIQQGCPPGYSQVATFQCSDPNFLQYRGFKYLHSRLLSHMQYEIQQLEDELDRLDDWDRIHGDREKRLVCLENDVLYQRCDQFPEEFQLEFERPRPEVFAELKRKLLEYDELVQKTREITLLQRPSTKDYRSVRSWFANHAPLVHGEVQYLKHREDIITLRPGRECAGFDGFVERMLHVLDAGLCRLGCPIIRKLFITQELQEKTTDARLQYYAPARVDKLVGFIITGVIFMLLILPVVALYELSNVGRRESPFEAIGILIIFTLLFAAAMSALTKATRQELFAASAAYCAVLVVFISNFSTQAVTLV
ncbi:hypothetical protein KC332_g7252 [Hortaea werneckii]|nr:hypothetical protein KC358_g16081 [Hortaea werneckii]KAI6822635.1 hypothetical protein KC350_g9354 [Hortaea werneckii]KAI6906121.1 hypothetical protein KC348_g14760 [Hortaea werneckii]KAI6919526.1 hypothetical protein KC341_g17225 [Hortaea werneckii]KAI6957149.1 hypothetical protein KC321_g14752 [Hortaea werneckii]